MKKLLAMLLVGIIVLSLAACGGNSDIILDDNDIISSSEETSEDLTASEDLATNESSQNATSSKKEEVVESQKTNSNSEWRKFIKDYEKWVDNYIAFMKKYNDNPTDFSLLADYSKMLTEMADWAERADELELEIVDTAEALEYSAELMRIAAKLAEAGADMYE